MDHVDVVTTKQIGRTFRDAGDDYDRFLRRRMGREHLFSKLTLVFCRVLLQFSGWRRVREWRRVFYSAVCRWLCLTPYGYIPWVYNHGVIDLQSSARPTTSTSHELATVPILPSNAPDCGRTFQETFVNSYGKQCGIYPYFQTMSTKRRNCSSIRHDNTRER